MKKELRALGLSLLIVGLVIAVFFANAALAQWRVDVNMERTRIVETMVE